MTESEKIKVAEKCGLVYSSKDAEGELQFIGTEKQWQKFDRCLENEEMGKWICPECSEERKDDPRVEVGMKCGSCAGYGTVIE